MQDLIQISLWHGCSTVHLLLIFRTSFPKNTSEGQLLNISINFDKFHVCSKWTKEMRFWLSIIINLTRSFFIKKCNDSHAKFTERESPRGKRLTPHLNPRVFWSYLMLIDVWEIFICYLYEKHRYIILTLNSIYTHGSILKSLIRAKNVKPCHGKARSNTLLLTLSKLRKEIIYWNL